MSATGLVALSSALAPERVLYCTKLFNIFVLVHEHVSMLIFAIPHGAVGVGVFVQLAFPEDLFNAISVVVYGFLHTSHVDVVYMLGS